MKIHDLNDPLQTNKETSMQQARTRLREYMDDTFSEFLDVNVLSAKDVYQVILESAEAQCKYYQNQADLNDEFVSRLKGQF
mgnify:CR=1 FL=1|jgi:hypothetical protein